MATKVKLPIPLGGKVLIANPLGDAKKNDEIEKKGKKLPQAERDAFFTKHMASMWTNVEILATGKDCRELTVGDSVMGSPEAVQTASPTPDGKYMFIRESAFDGKW